MKLLDIIDYLRDSDRVGQLYNILNLPQDSETILIYMTDSLSLDSDLKFFDVEKTDDNLIFTENGVTYHQFFPLDFAVEIVESYFSDQEKGLDNTGLAKRLMDYRINDA